MAYLFDIDIDIKDFKIEWIKDDEFIYVYYEKPIRNIF
jgi:hypothetical protein